jgi:hypothetical protein
MFSFFPFTFFCYLRVVASVRVYVYIFKLALSHETLVTDVASLNLDFALQAPVPCRITHIYDICVYSIGLI